MAIPIPHDVLRIRACRETDPEPRDHLPDLRYGSFVRYSGFHFGTGENEVSAPNGEGVLEVHVLVSRESR